jgi:hypothetical protein
LLYAAPFMAIVGIAVKRDILSRGPGVASTGASLF